MSKKKIVLLAAIIILIIPVVIAILALQNPTWSNAAVFRKTEAFVSRLILSRINVVTIPQNQDFESLPKLHFLKLLALQKGEIKVISASDIGDKDFAELQGKDPDESFNHFIIATIEPLDLMGKSRAEKRAVVESVDNLAIQGKIDAVVEATASDLARSNNWGREGARRLHKAGVIRCVIFDGGHHVGSLPLGPNILLAPVSYHGGKLYASHWFTRDAVPMHELTNALKDGGVNSVVAHFPRSGIPVKNKEGMAGLAAQAILKAAESNQGDTPASDETGRPSRAPEHPNGADNPAASDSLFISLNTGHTATKADILKKVKEDIQKSEQETKDVKHVYIGVTFGNSMFPRVSKKIKYDGEDLTDFLDKRLPYKVSVLSEPLSTWDIFLYRLGISR